MRFDQAFSRRTGPPQNGLAETYFGAESVGAGAAAFLVFLCELWCLVVFFGAMVPESGAGAGVASGAGAGAGAAAAGGADGAGVLAVWARTGAANSAVARKAALIRGSFIGSPNFYY